MLIMLSNDKSLAPNNKNHPVFLFHLISTKLIACLFGVIIYYRQEFYRICQVIKLTIIV
jgi:hypothetical protein